MLHEGLLKELPDLAAELAAHDPVIHGRQLLLAHSGGRDSTLLLHALHRWRPASLDLQVLHVNYGLRNQASADDAAFSKDLAKSLGLVHHCLDISQVEREERRGESLQEWARRLRYKAFSHWSQKGWTVVMAHHLNDLAENALLRLSRGCSVGGMAGMKVWDRPFWRPLLTTSQADVTLAANKFRLAHREDETNAKLNYSRNVLRHEVIPALEKLFPGAAKRIAETASGAAEMAATVRRQLQGSFDADPEFNRKIGSMPREVAHEALVTALNLPPELRSRNLLDDLWRHLRDKPDASFRREAGGGYDVLYDGNQLQLVSSKIPAATCQHAANLEQTGFAVILQPGSHATFRLPERHLSLRARGLSPLLVKGYGASGSKTLRFTNRPHGLQMKKLMQAWGVPLDQRATSMVIEIDGNTRAVSIGKKFYEPDCTGKAQDVALPIEIEQEVQDHRES